MMRKDTVVNMIQELHTPLFNSATAVLVVDQDAASRSILVSYFEEMGVDVIEGISGVEALRLLRILGPGFFKFAFVDADIQDICSEELMLSLKKADSEMRGILCTKDAYHALAKLNHHAYGFEEVICKPFAKSALKNILWGVPEAALI